MSVFSHLQIYDPRERFAVGAADVVLAAGAALARLVPSRRPVTPPRRILLMRLERIGDLLMSAGAIESVRGLAPEAEIDLIVGSWNAGVAGRLRGIDRVEVLDAPWLARGSQASSIAALLRRAWAWRARAYDLAINFEGDIRSHALLALSGAPARVGLDMAGGGPLLTQRVEHRPTEHTASNAARLVDAAFGTSSAEARRPFRLDLPDDARARAAGLVGGHRRLVAMHASGGRAIKQWDLDRFAEVAARIGADGNTTIVLTGAPGDEATTRHVRGLVPSGVSTIDLSGSADLLTLAAVLERCSLLVTGDTGPMHVAAAVGTPVVAVFGPSDPVRYLPRGAPHRVVRIDLPCAPCNRLRLPPARCQGHTPDCLVGVTVESVHRAAEELLAEETSRPDARARAGTGP